MLYSPEIKILVSKQLTGGAEAEAEDKAILTWMNPERGQLLHPWGIH